MQHGQAAEAQQQAQGSAHPPAMAAAAAAPAAAESEATVTIEDLPDSALGAIMAHVGQNRASSLLLVSKRWCRVFMSDPAPWRQLPRCRDAALELALLRRVGSKLAVLSLGYPSSPEEPVQRLACAEPRQLQQLEVEWAVPQVVPALPRFSRLTRLLVRSLQAEILPAMCAVLPQLPLLRWLSLSGGDIPQQLCAVLPQLPLLCWLALSGGTMPQQLCAAVAASTQLVELSLHMGSFEAPQSLLQLTSLRQLSALQLVALGQEERLQPPSPSLFLALKWYAFEHPRTGVQLGDCAVEFCSFAERDVSEEECSTHTADGLPAYLRIRRAASPAGLAGLLSMLRPGGVAAVQAVNLASCSISEAALEPCTALSAMTRLFIEDCTVQDSWEAAMAAVLRRAPLLRSLSVTSRGLQELPQCLVAYTGLQHLDLELDELQVLAVGPYLSGLQWLAVHNSVLLQLGPALAVATALTGLNLSHGAASSIGEVLGELPPLRELHLPRLQQLPTEGWHTLSALQLLSLSGNPDLAPTEGQLAALLSHLPLLQELCLPCMGLTQLPQCLPPGLRSLNISWNQFESLPMGLTSATLLTRLDISSIGRRPPVTIESVDRLLSQLPHLRQLEVHWMGSPGEIRRHIKHVLSLRSE